MKQKFLSIVILLTLILFPSLTSFAQQAAAEYEKVNNPFSGYPEPVDIAILKIEGGEDLEAIIANAMMKDEVILKKFNLFSLSLLNENKEILGLKKLQADDPKTQKALLDKFKIKFIVAGNAITNDEFTLNIINCRDGNIEYSGKYKNSANSTPVKDVIKYFTENVQTVYTSSGSIVINVTPLDAEIFLDGNISQSGNAIALKKGVHNIKIKKQGSNEINDTVLIVNGQKREKAYSLKEITGRLSLSIVPQDAAVSLFEESSLIKSWTGAKTGYELKPGKYTIRAGKNGYVNQTKEVTIEGNAALNIDMKLELIKIKGFLKNAIVTEGSLLHNVRAEEDNGKYNIRYDLDGDLEKDYEVKIYLMNKKDMNYEYQLNMISGDAGKGKFAGTGRKVVWNYEDEFKGGVDNDGLYFKITAEKIGGGIAWYVWVGGIAAGGAAAVLLGLKKDSGTGGNTGSTAAIPTPPARPAK
jgi:hypothetical protein